MKNIRTSPSHARESRRGVALIAAVIVTIAAMSFGLMLMVTAGGREREVVGRLDDRRAELLAEAALSEGITAMALGQSGNVGTPGAPALFGGGVFWVTSTDLAGGQTRLSATALLGSGRAGLSAVVRRPGSEPLFQAVIHSKDALVLASSVQVDSFDSSVDTYAAQAVNVSGALTYANAEGHVASNAGITLNSDAHVFGNATPGPSSSVALSAGSYVDGSTAPAAAEFEFPPIAYPGLPSAGAYAVPNGSFDTLAPGDYGMTSMSIGKDAQLTIVGPATIEVEDFVGGKDANLVIDATGGPVTIYVKNSYTHTSGFEADASSGSPMALAFFIGGADPIVFPSATNVRGAYYAPEADVTFASDNEVWGSFAAKSVLMSSAMSFHYDEALQEHWEVDGDGVGDVEVLARYSDWTSGNGLLVNRKDPFTALNLDKADLPIPSEAWWNP